MHNTPLQEIVFFAKMILTHLILSQKDNKVNFEKHVNRFGTKNCSITELLRFCNLALKFH